MKYVIVLQFIMLFQSCGQRSDLACSARYDKIHDLYSAILAERNRAYAQGAVDGTGMLYRGMPSFHGLKEVCTASELLVIEVLLGPPVDARPDADEVFKDCAHKDDK